MRITPFILTALLLASCASPPTAKLTVTPSPADEAAMAGVVGVLAEEAMDAVGMDDQMMADELAPSAAQRALLADTTKPNMGDLGTLLKGVVNTWGEFEARFSAKARGRYEYDLVGFKLTQASVTPKDTTVIHCAGKGDEPLHDLTFEGRSLVPDLATLSVAIKDDHALKLYGGKNLFKAWPSAMNAPYPVTKAVASGFGADAASASTLSAMLALGDGETGSGIATTLAIPMTLDLKSQTVPQLHADGKATWKLDVLKREVSFDYASQVDWTFENGATLRLPAMTYAGTPHKVSLQKAALILILFNGVKAAKNQRAKH